MLCLYLCIAGLHPKAPLLFCVKNYSTRLANIKALLRYSGDCSDYVSTAILYLNQACQTYLGLMLESL